MAGLAAGGGVTAAPVTGVRPVTGAPVTDVRPVAASAVTGSRRSTRVLVVDDHALFRRGLRIALSPERDIDIVAECGDTASAVELVARLVPDVVLVDAGIPFEGGVAACAAITGAAPGVRVLLLVAGTDWPDARAAKEAGSWGSLVKDGSSEEVAAAIRAVADAPDREPPTTSDRD